MNLIDTSDPTSIGVLIISVLTLAGALLASRMLRPVERLASRFNTSITGRKSDRKKIRRATPLATATPLTGEMPHPKHATPRRSSIPTAPGAPIAQSAITAMGIDQQWDRIADLMDSDITRLRQASSDHGKAETQLYAAEFSLSELFRKFPGARDVINPVTYVEFPALKPRKPDQYADNQSSDQSAAHADDINHAASA